MNEKTRKTLTDKVTSLAQSAAEPFKETSGPVRHFMNEGIAFELKGDSITLFDEITHIFLKQENWGEKYSEKYVENILQQLLAKVLKNGNSDKLPQYLDDLVNEFNSYSKEHTVYVPVLGIQMTIPALPIGKVILKVIDGPEFDALIARVEEITHSSKNTPEEQEFFIQFEKSTLTQNLKGQVCAEFTTVAESTRAQERAEEETRRVIDLFRYSIPALYPDGFEVFVGLQGEVVRVPRLTPIFSTDNKSFSIQSSIVGSLYPFELSEPNLEHMSKIGVLKLSAILSKLERELNDFEKTTLRAVHWIANAQNQQEVENKFINLITCLEAFLTPRDGNPIGTAIAEGVAIFLASDVENRKRLKNVFSIFIDSEVRSHTVDKKQYLILISKN